MVATLVLVLSCQGEQLSNFEKYSVQIAQEKSVIGDKEQSEQFAYVEKHLDVLRDGILTLSDDEEFKSLLNAEIEKMYDGDYNVMIGDLFKKSSNLERKLNQSGFIKDGNFSASLDAFNGIIDDDKKIDLFAQVFIPNYTIMKEADKIQSIPTIVSYNGDESQTEIEGIKLVNGSIQKVMVNGEYMLNNLVWVLSLTPGTIPEGLVDERMSKNARDVAGHPSQTPMTINCLGLNENPCNANMAEGEIVWTYSWSIKCLKEGVFSGSADLYATLATGWENNINPHFQQFEPAHWYGDTQWVHKYTVNAGFLNSCMEDQSGGINLRIIRDFNSSNDLNDSGGRGDICYYLWFEHDAWPAGLRFKTLSPNWSPTTSLQMQYRSTDVNYEDGTFTAVEKCLPCSPGNGSLPCAVRDNSACAEFTYCVKTF